MKVNLGFRFGFCLLLFLGLTLASHAKEPATRAFDSDYSAALATADRFLQAWQSGDAENGMALLSSHAKEKASAEVLETFFTTDIANKRAYEIDRGKMLQRRRYEFPVVLIGAAHSARARRRFSSVVLVNTGHNDWAVDKLP